MLLRNGKIPGELGVSFSPRLQHALSIAKQNKTSGASVLLTPDQQHKERETIHNTEWQSQSSSSYLRSKIWDSPTTGMFAVF
jgi:hypothetical protein